MMPRLPLYYVKAVLHVGKPGAWVAILTAAGPSSARQPALGRPGPPHLQATCVPHGHDRRGRAFPLLAVAGVGAWAVPAAVQIGIVMAGIAASRASTCFRTRSPPTSSTPTPSSPRREAMYYGAGGACVQQAAASLGQLLLQRAAPARRHPWHELRAAPGRPHFGVQYDALFRIFRSYDLPDEVGRFPGLGCGRTPPATGPPCHKLTSGAEIRWVQRTRRGQAAPRRRAPPGRDAAQPPSPTPARPGRTTQLRRGRGGAHAANAPREPVRHASPPRLPSEGWGTA